MKAKGVISTLICMMLLSLVLFSLVACEDASTNPIVDDPDLEINVTPPPTIIFKLVIEREGLQQGTIDWWTSGEADVKTTLSTTRLKEDGSIPSQVLKVQGVGFGTGGWSFVGPTWMGEGNFKIEYQIDGDFNPADELCLLTLNVNEIWSEVESVGQSAGVAAMDVQPGQKVSFNDLVFTELNNPVEYSAPDPVAGGLLIWKNYFRVYIREGAGATNCQFPTN